MANQITVTIERCVQCENHACYEMYHGQPPDYGVFCKIQPLDGVVPYHTVGGVVEVKLVAVSESPSRVRIPDDCPILLEQKAAKDLAAAQERRINEAVEKFKQEPGMSLLEHYKMYEEQVRRQTDGALD